VGAVDDRVDVGWVGDFIEVDLCVVWVFVEEWVDVDYLVF